jgi:hypothetical protein
LLISLDERAGSTGRDMAVEDFAAEMMDVEALLTQLAA